jgi:hypothetical protein
MIKKTKPNSLKELKEYALILSYRALGYTDKEISSILKKSLVLV